MQPVSVAVSQKGIHQPLLTLFSDLKMAFFKESNQTRYQEFVDHQTEMTKTFFIAGTGHHDFNDTALISPIARFVGHNKGPLSAYKAFEIIRAYTKAELDTYLLNQPTMLLEETPSSYPELSAAFVKTPQGALQEQRLESSPSDAVTPDSQVPAIPIPDTPVNKQN
jgi:hypothetical protein